MSIYIYTKKKVLWYADLFGLSWVYTKKKVLVKKVLDLFILKRRLS